jgi:hypothetical protein
VVVLQKIGFEAEALDWFRSGQSLGVYQIPEVGSKHFRLDMPVHLTHFEMTVAVREALGDLKATLGQGT